MKEELQEAYKLNHITKENLKHMHNSLDQIKIIMIKLDEYPDSKGLVHTDLGLSNWIVKDNKVTPIDFSLCGMGYYLMDMSSLMANFENISYRKIALKGFEKASNTKVNIRHLEAFFALGVMMFITTQHNRLYMQDWFKGSMERWTMTILDPFLNNKTFLLK
jgi:thiamine kinase-like enzyme